MCGIAGIYTRKRELISDTARLTEMQKRIGHRGPDDRDVTVLPDHGVALIHARLSVIDISSLGHQPLWNDDHTIAIVFNGEIYNFEEIRRELEADGVHFFSKTDTEVIVKGYERWGREVVHKLKGMFAFGLWNGRTRTLWLVRDRLGKKPLYYSFDPTHKTLLFASEMKALMAWNDTKRAISKSALHSYLAFGYIPAPHTIFEGIQKLPAGHELIYDGSSIELNQFWSLPYAGTWESSPTAYHKAIREKLMAAVRRRLISDVPLGVFLSGGVDSSIVVGLMSEMVNEPIHTFSAAYDVGERSFKYNQDADIAEIVSRKFKTNHKRLTIRPERNLLECVQNVVWHADEPHANPTLVATYALAEAVKHEGVTVILTGDGSDEVFGGYPRYLADRIISSFRRMPPSFQSLALSVLRLGKADVANKIRHKISLSPRTPEWYLNWWEQFTAAERMSFVTPAYHEGLNAPDMSIAHHLETMVTKSDQEALSLLDLALWIPDESNMRLDKMTMAHGVEGRCPFLDHEVVELGTSIPFEQKVAFGWNTRQGKTLLRNTFKDILPYEVFAGKKKGWFSPRFYWVKDILWPEVEKTIRWLPETGIFSPEITRVLKPFPPTDYNQQKLWSLFIFGLWYKKYVN